MDKEYAMSQNRRTQYPHEYYPDGLADVNRFCLGQTYFGQPRILYEYPILQHGLFGDGDNPLTDRVIIDGATGVFCAIVTHRGNPFGDQSLWNCYLRDAPEFDPPLPEPRLDEPLHWLEPYTGSGSFEEPLTHIVAARAPALTDPPEPLSDCSLIQ